MRAHTATAVLPSLLGAAVLAGCGGSDGSGTEAAAPPATSAPTTTGGASGVVTSCDPVELRGHGAQEITVRGASCDDIRPVIAAAEGKGRAAYSSGGLRCTPADAPDGDDVYTCTGDGTTLRFLYGTLPL